MNEPTPFAADFPFAYHRSRVAGSHLPKGFPLRGSCRGEAETDEVETSGNHPVSGERVPPYHSRTVTALRRKRTPHPSFVRVSANERHLPLKGKALSGIRLRRVD